MLERFAISIAASTILGVLAKLAFLYYEAQKNGHDWWDEEALPQEGLVHILLALFLIFFRGKMMHDHAAFFVELSDKKVNTFKEGRSYDRLIRAGLLCGYISWLLWAPMIYFIDKPERFAKFFVACLAFATVSLAMELQTRKEPDPRRAFWVIPNMIYAVLAMWLSSPSYAIWAALGLLLMLLIDWLVSDPFADHLA